MQQNPFGARTLSIRFTVQPDTTGQRDQSGSSPAPASPNPAAKDDPEEQTARQPRA